MKRVIGVVFALVLACSALASDIDLVVVADTSQSMLPYFDDLRTYLLHDLLRQKLHRGDTFHLLSFASTPEVETAAPLSDEQAAQSAFARLALLQPLGRYTDLIAALRFLLEYGRALPETNPKTVLLMTDGIHDPPPGSPNQLPEAEVRAAVREIAASLRSAGWRIHVLKVPPTAGAADQGLPSYLDDLAESLEVPVVTYDPGRRDEVTGLVTGFPTLGFPPDLGTVGRRLTVPFTVRNYRDESILLRLTGVVSRGMNLLERPVDVAVPPNGTAVLEAAVRLPLSLAAGQQQLTVSLAFADGQRISPVEGTLSFSYTGRAGGLAARFKPIWLVYLLGAAIVLYVLVRLFLLMLRKLQEVSLGGLARAASAAVPAAEPAAPAEPRPGRREAAALPAVRPHRPAAPPRRARVPLMASRAKYVRQPPPAAPRRPRPTVQSVRRALPVVRQPEGLPPLIEMRVSQQNSRIGMRNVHRIMPNSSRSVGGGWSSYLVFLVRTPRAVAEISNEGGRYTFTALRPEFFPELSGPVKDCLGVQIPFAGPKGHRLAISFRQWVSALDEINALMRSVRRGG